MNLEKLTFAELWKLSQPETLMETTEKYHAFLRAEVPDAIQEGIFSYALAESSLEEHTTRCWREKLNFLTGGELKAALRAAAAREKCTPSDGWNRRLVTISHYKFPDYWARVALASLIMIHCRGHGVRATYFDAGDGDFVVFVQTDREGAAKLTHKPGIQWGDIKRFLDDCGVPTWLVFPWVPRGNDGMLVNPCVWPCNTPDVNEIAKGLVQ